MGRIGIKGLLKWRRLWNKVALINTSWRCAVNSIQILSPTEQLDSMNMCLSSCGRVHRLKILFLLLPLAGASQHGWADSAAVAIDVGHSKQNPGAISARGRAEFEFNRDLARVVQQVLIDRQINSFMIGAAGDVSDLQLRPAIANTHTAGFLLSIHHDSAQPVYFKTWRWQGKSLPYSDNFSGYSLFVSRKNPALAKSLECAQTIGRALRRQGFSPATHHAEPVPGESRAWADQRNGVYYYDDLVVLKSANMPAVLLEAGVIVNRMQEQVLSDIRTQNRIAGAIAQGLQDCRVLG